MLAAIYNGKKNIRLVNIQKPLPGPDEVLLKIKNVGICGTDLHIYNGGTDVKKGIIIGHEFSGEVTAIGRNVTNIKPGNRVVAEHVVSCRKCYYCLRGKPNLCVKAQVFGVHLPGALAEFMLVPSNLVYPFPKSISFEEAALIEPLTIAMFAASGAGFLLEKKVAVVGQGPIGLLLDQVLKAAGAQVIGIDVLDNRLDFAIKKHWVDVGLNASSKGFEEKFKNAAPLGVDTVFEAVGKQATAQLSFQIARRDGDVFLLGVFEQPATIDLMQLIRKELNVFGSWTCSFSFPASIDLLEQGKVDLKSLITHRYPLKDVERAFAEASAYTGNRIKTIISVS